MRNVNNTQLNSESTFDEILLALGFASAEQIEYAALIRQSELASITKADMRAGRRARLLSEVLMDMVVVSMEDVRVCQKVQRYLRRA
ncbi:MAG: hypothetical protein K2X77_32760 [Candidatus Obscuribacterales bacterium]|nr:hypothetical protein [Candidatus Obscuribacterales bacterium]